VQFNIGQLIRAVFSAPGIDKPPGRDGQLKDAIGPASNWPRGKIHRKHPPRDRGQHPKLDTPRKHKQHTHPMRDEHGAFTLVGRARIKHEPSPAVDGLVSASRVVEIQRRKWLAGISAQRGF
jgi:hypothetical protein